MVLSVSTAAVANAGEVALRPRFRRRPPSAAEQARREAWGRQWGQVGHEWKQANNPKGK